MFKLSLHKASSVAHSSWTLKPGCGFGGSSRPWKLIWDQVGHTQKSKIRKRNEGKYFLLKTKTSKSWGILELLVTSFPMTVHTSLRILAKRFPNAEVIGITLSPEQAVCRKSLRLLWRFDHALCFALAECKAHIESVEKLLHRRLRGLASWPRKLAYQTWASRWWMLLRWSPELRSDDFWGLYVFNVVVHRFLYYVVHRLWRNFEQRSLSSVFEVPWGPNSLIHVAERGWGILRCHTTVSW